MADLPHNWNGQASRSLKTLVRATLEDARRNPGEWQNRTILEARVRYHPGMRHPDGSMGVFEIRGTPHGSTGNQFHRSDVSEAATLLFQCYTN
jgi:hypothetical protein